MSFSNFGRTSPFRPLSREDIGVSHFQHKNLEEILKAADYIENSLLKKGAQINDSPKRQYLIDRVIQKSSPKISSNKLN